MLLSKSFGYALRCILFIASVKDEERLVQIDEIASRLNVPKHFLGKIMQQLVKKDLLRSIKGPFGGFALSANTLNTPLINLLEIIEGKDMFQGCAIRLGSCDERSPCPLHNEISRIRVEMQVLFSRILIGDLLKFDKNELIRSITLEQ